MSSMVGSHQECPLGSPVIVGTKNASTLPMWEMPPFQGQLCLTPENCSFRL